MTDILWSDPATSSSEIDTVSVGSDGWGDNDRGLSYVFNEDVVEEFLDKH